MTALTDTLRERLSRRGRRAQVDCGALGTVTVEALSPRECAALGKRDGGRGLLYAACRELQQAGEALRREGRLFIPEEVTQYVSDEEARQAAQVILELSGVTGEDKAMVSGRSDRSAELKDPETGFRLGSVRQETGRTDAAENDEVRLDSVQQVTDSKEVRPLSVQMPEAVLEEIRLSSVQSDREKCAGSGQVSRETGAGTAEGDSAPKTDKKVQGMGGAPTGRTQNVVRPSEAATTEGGALAGRELGLHETESEFPEAMHETKSEIRGDGPGSLHEIESEFPETVHETKSEIRGDRQERLHETESEFAERTARLLLEGLRRAAAVR